MPEKKGLNNTTIALMICVAVFFDVLQVLLSFLWLGWLAGIFAGLTFWLWFRMHGISFMKPKRFLTFGGASLIEVIPIPFLAALPAWTAAVSYLALSSKLQEIVPGAGIVKSDIIKK
ncbi:MAG: hypothetical protein Q7S54_00765 [bacterium]|nr:hypothetical protein [bacterium]